MDQWHHNIEGWFDFENLYNTQVNLSQDGAHFVEVGCWKGRSTAYLAWAIIESNKSIKLDAVDTWAGSYEHRDDASVLNDTLYEEFLNNLKPAEHFVKAVRMESVEAAKLYEDSSLDFVFIDANHEYDAVLADINAWLPKVKNGGYIGGHDFPIAPGVRAAVEQLCAGFTTDNNSWLFHKG